VERVEAGTGTIEDAITVGVTTPWTLDSYAGELYRRYFGKDDPGTLVIQSPTTTMNPVMDPRIIDRAMAEDEPRARAEYLAQFRDDLEGFVPREVVEALVEPGVQERGPIRGTRYCAFCDPAGGSGQDEMTMAVAHQEGGKPVLDCVRAKKPPFSPDAVCREFC